MASIFFILNDFFNILIHPLDLVQINGILKYRKDYFNLKNSGWKGRSDTPSVTLGISVKKPETIKCLRLSIKNVTTTGNSTTISSVNRFQIFLFSDIF